jgi:hypothetical protein
MWGDPHRVLRERLGDRGGRRDVLLSESGEHRSRFRGESFDASNQDLGPEQVRDANAPARGGGFVGRSDSPQRRPELRVSGGPLPGAVQETVIGEDHLRAVGEEQVVADGDSGRAQRIDLGEERLRIH